MKWNEIEWRQQIFDGKVNEQFPFEFTPNDTPTAAIKILF